MTITQQISQFIINHWQLCAVLVVALIWLLIEELLQFKSSASRISPAQTTLLMNRENAVVVDLRKQTTFSQGHVIGAINIEHADLDAKIQKLAKHKNSPLIFLGENDAQAMAVTAKLQRQGFTKIYVMQGGISAWKAANLPLTKN